MGKTLSDMDRKPERKYNKIKFLEAEIKILYSKVAEEMNR